MCLYGPQRSVHSSWNEVRKRNCSSWSVRELNVGRINLSCTNGRQNVCRASDAIRSGTRYAKWAGGSRSQTHRRAAKGGFTQDDGNVRGLAPTHTILSFGSSCCSSFVERLFAPIILSSIPIPVPGQYRLSRCLE